VKVFMFHLMPWPYLPDDYHDSAWVRIPNSLYDPVKGQDLYNRYLDELVACEELGFDGVCVNEHHQNAYGLMPSPNVFGMTLARETQRMKIAVLGNAVPFYNPPQRVAEEFAMIDNVSRGRLIAGLVVGGGPEYTSFGLTPTEARPRYREAVDLIVQSWTRPGPFSFTGDYYHFANVNLWPRPVQQPHPPIWIPGGGSIETMEYVAERRYSYMGLPYFSTAVFERTFNDFRSACERSGYPAHPEQMGVLLPVYVSDSDESARREFEPHIDYLAHRLLAGAFSTPPGYTSAKSVARMMENNRSFLGDADGWDDLVTNFIICGSAETVRSQLAERCERLGIGNLLVLLQVGTLPADLTRQNQQRFATEVMPYIRAQFPHDGEKPEMVVPAPAAGPALRLSGADMALPLEGHGSGTPILWLGSGFGEQTWNAATSRLAEQHRVLVPTYPTGSSLERFRTMDALVLGLVRALDRLGVPRLAVAGTSLGGWLAAEFAARYPERVEALVLMGSLGLGHPDLPAPPPIFHLLPMDLAPLVLRDRERADLASLPAFDPATRRRDGHAMLTEALETLARYGWNPYLHDPRLIERLDRYQGPALVIWGGDDQLLPSAPYAGAWSSLLHGTRHVIDGCGHLVAIERSDETVKIIEEWLTVREGTD
jgi:alkanesulfonate monooxygenase SsuD/methylene tetrahydromethanopterin reductase-like flavin-dependent oxidoreductase (luciferase family)/pimeloyl-ACP methyl ester carboxylesterase